MPACAQVSARAKKRGLPQMGTLGAGNHYAEVQVVDEVYDQAAARKMGIDTIGQVRMGVECSAARQLHVWQAQLRLALLRCSSAALLRRLCTCCVANLQMCPLLPHPRACPPACLSRCVS